MLAGEAFPSLSAQLLLLLHAMAPRWLHTVAALPAALLQKEPAAL
jgi:hypothetical protein